MERIAAIISWVFMPLLMPIYGLLLVFFIPAQPKSFVAMDAFYFFPIQVKWLFLLLFLVFIVLAPGLSLIVLKTNGSISSLSLPDRSERMTPISIMIFYTLVLYLFMLYQGDQIFVPAVLKGMALGGVLSSIIAYFWNKLEKISLHAIGAGSLFGFLYSYFLRLEAYEWWVLPLAIAVGGITLSARIYLHAHNLRQLLIGYLVGFGVQFFTILAYANL